MCNFFNGLKLTMLKILMFFLMLLVVSACNEIKPSIENYSNSIVERVSLENRVVNGRAFVPVNIKGKNFLFLLDTGASSTVIDETIDLSNENFVSRDLVGSVVDPVFSKSYRLKNAKIGSLRIPEEPTYVMNLGSSNRERRLRNTYSGIIGMNSFKNYVLYIDSRLEELYFLTKLPFSEDSLGEKFDLSFDKYDLPTITIDIPNGDREKMLIDTGAEISSLQIEVFNKVVKRSGARVTKASIEGASGSYVTEMTWLDVFSFGGITHQDVEILKSSTSLLGMDVLSNYIITLDFPNKKLYLKPY